jgi:primosomal protein N' (replication factor Y)
MVAVRPLSLKAEVFRKTSKLSAGSAIADVWVDSGVYHLDNTFQYLIPEELNDVVDVGVRVVVPFASRECEAIVIYKRPIDNQGGMKRISKVITPFPVATRESLDLIAEVSRRWASHPYDVVRSAIPPRVASVDKAGFAQRDVSPVHHKAVRKYLQFPPARNPFSLIAEYVQNAERKGSLLILLPNAKSIEYLQAFLPGAIVLDSHQEKTTRYRNYLETLFGSNLVVIGTRSAVFAPLRDLTEIIIVNENSEQFYEVRAPGWNAREIAILRSSDRSVSLTFAGYVPSVEVAKDIESGYIKYLPVKDRISIKSFQQVRGELLPEGIFTSIRTLLKKGPVLFVAPRKGYAQAVLCSQCRNVARCKCGGKIVQKSRAGDFECTLCLDIFLDWQCSWCKGKKAILLGRGSERIVQELGRSFPNHSITESSGERILAHYAPNSGMVVATPGAIPHSVTGYSAVVALDSENLFSQADMKAQERAQQILFEAAGFLSPEGQMLIVAAHNHPVIAALASWKPSLLTQRELRERQEVALPPYTKAVTLEIDVSEATQLLRGLKSAHSQGRLPINTRILGPSNTSSKKSKIILMTPLEDSDSLITLVHEFQRKRSATRKPLAILRINPYSL